MYTENYNNNFFLFLYNLKGLLKGTTTSYLVVVSSQHDPSLTKR